MAHASGDRTTQVPSGRQQAPVGVGQFAVEQVVPLPLYDPPWEVQKASVVMTHAPEPVEFTGRQQAPVGRVWQFVPVHAVPLPP
jgi:hypothetical protein